MQASDLQLDEARFRDAIFGKDIEKRARITHCDQGHKHHGPGAAGILIRAPRPDGTMTYLLQQRDKTADQPFTWGTFGGTLHQGESPRDGAMREVEEESGVKPGDYQIGPKAVDDHGKWAYTTYVADAPKAFWPSFDGSTPEESADWGWFTQDEMRELDLHPAFRSQLPKLIAVEKVGKEGYIHGFICVRPPCGKVPDKVTPDELTAGTNGSIVHVPSGYELGTFENAGGDTFVVHHGNGVDAPAHGNDGVKATLAILHVMRDKKDDVVHGGTREEPAEKPVSPEEPEVAMKRLYDVAYANMPAHKPEFVGGRPFDAMHDWDDPGLSEAIHDYVSPDSTINKDLRKKPSSWRSVPRGDYLAEGSPLAREVGILDKEVAHNTLKKPAVVYRGFTAPQSALDTFQPGQEFSNHAFVSTAWNPVLAADFALMRAYGHVPGPAEGKFPVVKAHGGKPVMMKINVPAGGHMFQGERDIAEFVLPRSSKFRVTDVSPDGSLITVDALPEGDTT